MNLGYWGHQVSTVDILFNIGVRSSASSATSPLHKVSAVSGQCYRGRLQAFKQITNADVCAERPSLNEVKEEYINEILTGRDTRVGCTEKP